MKLSKRLMALALAGAMALGMSAGAVSFPDVDETTPEGEAIIKLAEMGVLGGFEDGTFRPEETVTRAQFAKIIYMLQNPGTEDVNADEYKGPTNFPDVLEEQWFNGYVNWAVAEGIVGGYDDGTFKPDATLTMGQAVKMYVTANGTPADGIEYPQGFIDIAEEKGYLENVADFTGNDNAPRGTIALIGANTLEETSGEATEAADGTYTSVITKVDGNVLTFAPADEKGRGSIIDATAETTTPTDPPKGVKTVLSADQSKVTYADATDAEITVVDGTIDSDATGAAGTIADIKASDSENFYAAELTVEGGKVKAITYYKTGVATEIYDSYERILATPCTFYVFHNPGATSEISLYSNMLANPADVPFGMSSIQQPADTDYKTELAADPAKFWRVRITQPEDAKIGDVVYFTYELTTTDGLTTVTGTVKALICEPTKVEDMEITVNAGTVYNFDYDELYSKVTYTAGQPNGVPSFLIYDTENNAVVPSGTAYTTAFGGTVLRASGDVISYTAPDKTGTDSFVLQFNDGYGDCQCTVTVNVIE